MEVHREPLCHPYMIDFVNSFNWASDDSVFNQSKFSLTSWFPQDPEDTESNWAALLLLDGDPYISMTRHVSGKLIWAWVCESFTRNHGAELSRVCVCVGWHKNTCSVCVCACVRWVTQENMQTTQDTTQQVGSETKFDENGERDEIWRNWGKRRSLTKLGKETKCEEIADLKQVLKRTRKTWL